MIALGDNSIGSYFWQFDSEFDHKMPAIPDSFYPVHGILVDNNEPYGQVVNSYGTFSTSYQLNGAYETTTNNNKQATRCLCELRQRPRVEYDFCSGDMGSISTCAAEKVSQGWYPLELTSAGGAVFVQTFWRWED